MVTRGQIAEQRELERELKRRQEEVERAARVAPRALFLADVLGRAHDVLVNRCTASGRPFTPTESTVEAIGRALDQEVALGREVPEATLERVSDLLHRVGLRIESDGTTVRVLEA